MDFNFLAHTDRTLHNLQYWLNVELSGSVLFLFSFAYYYALYPLALAAIIFIPYMLAILLEERKFGWIIFFVIFVIIPGAIYFLAFQNSQHLTLLMFILIGQFYFYCFLLKLAVPTWLTD